MTETSARKKIVANKMTNEESKGLLSQKRTKSIADKENISGEENKTIDTINVNGEERKIIKATRRLNQTEVAGKESNLAENEDELKPKFTLKAPLTDTSVFTT